MNNTITNLNKLPVEEFEKALYNINMSTRKIKKSYISCTGYFASYKNKIQVAFESVLERDFYMLLEFDENVISYAEQPITINYEYKDGSKRRYTPDCLITYKDGTERYYEVKYINEIRNDSELREKLDFLKSYFYDEHTLKFDIFTDEDIGKIYLDNLKFLYKFAFIPQDNEKIVEINKILNEIDKINIKELLNVLSDNQIEQMKWLPYVWKYVFENIKVINLYEKFTMNTELEKRL
ncbi:Tn7 transposase TnsA N-terminal domain-containing protein [Aliarcobacter butzleri]|uniref:Tn7 transposase TnsA N-terminal domain-containing protein n=1 Tax=Aliarcobacter butzleri TaxID=28197 RepID=A0AAW7Q7E9_9BACT|nr:Tn7 transposase TnsA N-terminal domain-containing protein [Aliarcobacter butzleri]MDN5107224.1 Tn7 transposase TnsA N-terminal domain-containing protein [Aliarcobacter butzleri]MDN5122334.1 Tn7 transposase TnsA N-terminal domain-containing protein [Aliarcobacter butzleri]